MTDHTPISKVSRLDVISTGARRRWTLIEKQRIVAESYTAPRLEPAESRQRDRVMAFGIAIDVRVSATTAVRPSNCSNGGA